MGGKYDGLLWPGFIWLLEQGLVVSCGEQRN